MRNISPRIQINVDKINHSNIYTFKQNDDGVLRLALYKGQTAFDITGQTIKLGVKRSDKTLVELSDTGCFSVNNNELDIAFKNSMLAVNGVAECDLELSDSTGKMTTASFFIKIDKKALNDKAVEATNEFDTFSKTVAKVEEDYNSLRRIIIDENQAANLQDQVNKTNEQLDNKANLNEVFKKDIGININDFDEPTRQTFLEAQGIDVNYVLGEKNVKPKNTTFFNIYTSKNLFNANDSDVVKKAYILADGRIINMAEGSNNMKNVTGYIPVTEGQVLTTSYYDGSKRTAISCSHIACYDVNKNILSSLGSNNTFTTFTIPSGVRYIRTDFLVSVFESKGGFNSPMIELTSDGVFTEYEEYYEEYSEIPLKNIEKFNIPSKVSQLENDMNYINYLEHTNLFLKESAIVDKYINNDGSILSIKNCVLYAFIPVREYETISTNYKPDVIAFYDSNKILLSAPIKSKKIFYSIPLNCKYVSYAFSCKGSYNGTGVTLDTFLNTAIINKGSGALVSNSIKYAIKTSYYDTIWDSLGDSLTEAERYQTYVSAYLGLKGYHNNGIGGTRLSGTSANAMWQNVRINSLCPKANVITIAGGTNDVNKSDYSVGEISLDNFDTNTIVGAYNTILYKIMYRYNMINSSFSNVDTTGVEKVVSDGVDIIIITPPYNDNNTDNTSIGEVIKKVADMWGIPCVESMKNMRINKYNSDLYFSQNDRIHFLLNAHENWAKCIISKALEYKPLSN